MAAYYKRFAYYNENDPKAAAWLRELIREGLITDGEVDERSIEDVEPADVMGFARCHWFAGIGGWDLALQLAGYERWDVTTWTGSCPCQPFSAAGKGLGERDPRHLWPVWFKLIKAVRPPVIFGEQVEGKLGLAWLDGVCDDLEGTGYLVDPVILPAAAVGAPHLRHRIYWVAKEGEREDVLDLQTDLFGNAVPQRPEPARWTQVLLQRLQYQAVPEIPTSKLREGERLETSLVSREQGQGHGAKPSRPKEASSETVGAGHQEAGREQKCSIRPGSTPPGDRGAIASGTVRDDRSPLGPGCQQGLEFSVDRPDRPKEGIRLREHPDRVSRDELCPRNMGRRSTQTDHESVALDDAGTRVSIQNDDQGDAEGQASSDAAGVSAPHIRQRLYWVADSDLERRNGEHALLREGQEDSAQASGCGEDSWVGNSHGSGLERRSLRCNSPIEGGEWNPWAASLDCWIPCEEGKARRIEPGLEPVADGVPERVVRIRGYGNAIVPQLAAKFIQASVNL